MFPAGMPSMSGGAGGDATSGMSMSSGFNNSGWTVNTGSGSASGAPSALNPWLIAGLVAAGLLAWKMYVKK